MRAGGSYGPSALHRTETDHFACCRRLTAEAGEAGEAPAEAGVTPAKPGETPARLGGTRCRRSEMLSRRLWGRPAP